MRRNVRSCSSWQLYVIIDRAAVGDRDLTHITAAAIRGGADVIQLRDKQASDRQLLKEAVRLLPLTRAAGVPLLINDRADIAHAVGADGVHLGQEDLPVDAARRLLGAHRLIGKSTHNPEQAMAAEAEGADYIGLGPVFPTPTKPDYGSIGLGVIPQVCGSVRLPVVCIGGIDSRTISQVLEVGADRVAVVRAVCSAEDPEAAARGLKDLLAQQMSASPGRKAERTGCLS